MLFFFKRGKDGGGTGEGRILLVCLLLVARAGDRLEVSALAVSIRVFRQTAGSRIRAPGGGVPLVALERGRRQGGHDHQMGPRLVTVGKIAGNIFSA